MVGDGGAIAWLKMDGSDTRHGWSWLMSGRTILRQSELIDTRNLALRLRENLPADEEEAILKELQVRIELQQLPPTGTGSGASSKRHKIHAYVHSERLVNNSWESPSDPQEDGPSKSSPETLSFIANTVSDDTKKRYSNPNPN